MTIKLLDAHEAADYPGLVGKSAGVQTGVLVDRIGEPRVSRVMRGPMKQPRKAELRERLTYADRCVCALMREVEMLRALLVESEVRTISPTPTKWSAARWLRGWFA